MAGKILVNNPTEMLSVEYEGIVNDGAEDYDSSTAQGVKGGRETYQLIEKNGGTRLITECDMAAELFDMMAVAWNKALLKIKELADQA